MKEIKLIKRYPHSRTEDIVDAYMRGWNDALDAVQNGKFHIAERNETESECNTCKYAEDADEHCELCGIADINNYEPSADRKTENCSEKPNNSTISKMEQVDEPQKWETPPKFEHKGVTTTCVNVMASKLEYEVKHPSCETCRYDEPNNPKCDECIVGEDKPSNYAPQTDCPWK